MLRQVNRDDFLAVSQAITGFVMASVIAHHPHLLRMPNGKLLRWRLEDKCLTTKSSTTPRTATK